MTYETMLIILSGNSKSVIREYEKAMKKLVVDTRVIRRK